jgi:ketosteroid isomerase-like protein
VVVAPDSSSGSDETPASGAGRARRRPRDTPAEPRPWAAAFRRAERSRPRCRAFVVEIERIEPAGDDRVVALFRFHGRGREDWVFDVEEVFDAEDRVVTVGRQHAKPKHGGPEVEMRIAQVWTFRDGLIARMEMYADRDEALEAAGLEEEAMSQENVEFAWSVFGRWNAGERRFPDEQIHPDVVLVSRILGKAVRGRAGVRRYLREIDEQFDEWEMAIEDWRDAGDCVAALGHVRLRGRRSGVAFDQPLGILFKIRDGQLLRFETFLDDPAGALRAAGLSE